MSYRNISPPSASSASSGMSSSSAAIDRAIRLVPSFWLLLIYWCIGLVIGLLYLHPTELKIHQLAGWDHAVWIGIGVAVTLTTNWAYGKISEDRGRSLDRFTLIFFSVFNGLCETLLFLASFKFGAALATAYTHNPIWIFTAGFVTLFCYSGLIHALFWIKILPPHLNRDAQLQPLRRLWMIGLVVMTLLWAWLYYGYQDFWSVALLHILVDIAMVQSIHYSLVSPSPWLASAPPSHPGSQTR